MEDLFAKLAIHAVTVVGKAAFGLAVSRAVRNVHDYVSRPRDDKDNITPSSSQRRLTEPVFSTIDSKSDSTLNKADTSASEAAAAAATPDGTEARLRRQSERQATTKKLISKDTGMVATFRSADNTLLSELAIQQRRMQQKVSILVPSIEVLEIAAAKSNSAALKAVVGMSTELTSLLNQLGSFPAETETPPRLACVQVILHKVDEILPYVNLAMSLHSGSTLARDTSAFVHTNVPTRSNQISNNGQSPLSLSVLLRASRALRLQSHFACRVYRLFRANAAAAAWAWKLEYRAALVTVILRWEPSPRPTTNKNDETEKNTKQDIFLNEISQKGVKYGDIVVRESFAPELNDDGAVFDETCGESEIRIPLEKLKRQYYSVAGNLLRLPESVGHVLVLQMDDDFVALEAIHAQVDPQSDDDEDDEAEDDEAEETDKKEKDDKEDEDDDKNSDDEEEKENQKAEDESENEENEDENNKNKNEAEKSGKDDNNIDSNNKSEVPTLKEKSNSKTFSGNESKDIKAVEKEDGKNKVSWCLDGLHVFEAVIRLASIEISEQVDDHADVDDDVLLARLQVDSK